MRTKNGNVNVTKVKHPGAVDPNKLAKRPGAVVHNATKKQTVSMEAKVKIKPTHRRGAK